MTKEEGDRHGHRWSIYEIFMVQKMWAKGKSEDEIADMMGVSRYAIGRAIRRWRTAGGQFPARKAGTKKGSKGAKRWSRKDDKLLRMLHGLGLPAADIKLNFPKRSMIAIQARIHKLNRTKNGVLHV